MAQAPRSNKRAYSDEVTPLPGELDLMAIVLEGRHGTHAKDVAEFFVEANTHNGDAPRAWAWLGVAKRLKERAEARLGGKDI